MRQNFHPDIKEKASIYVPAVGKVTIMILLRNTLVGSLPRLSAIHADQVQRQVQNRPEIKGRPADAIEKPGTVEHAAPTGR